MEKISSKLEKVRQEYDKVSEEHIAVATEHRVCELTFFSHWCGSRSEGVP